MRFLPLRMLRDWARRLRERVRAAEESESSSDSDSESGWAMRSCRLYTKRVCSAMGRISRNVKGHVANSRVRMLLTSELFVEFVQRCLLVYAPNA